MSWTELTYWQWTLLCTGGMLIGMAKAGLKGLGLIVVVLLAQVFPAKYSTGLVLLLLMAADLMAVVYYRRDAHWPVVWRLMPPALLGIFLGVWMGESMDDLTFRRVLAWVIIVGLVMIIGMEYRPPSQRVVRHPIVSGLAGLAGGFTTMVGNAAGPVMSLYLLAAQLPKLAFLGTSAWFFLLMNWVKLPFHIWSWRTVSVQSFWIDVFALPFVAIGFFAGIRIIRWIPDKAFRYFVMIVTAIAAVRMLV
ncbi:MAG: sulfite exporter TauE/SafE family protein [Saprospiraceae bacterium]